MYHATGILFLWAVIHTEAFSDAIFINAALLSCAAMFLSAKVILEGNFVIYQNIDSVLNVQLFDGLFLISFL